MTADTIEWVEVPVGKGGIGAGRPGQRLAMATYRRYAIGGASEEIIVSGSLIERIGSPERVVILADPNLGRFALRPSDTGRKVSRSKRASKNIRVACGGLAKVLGFPANPDPVRLRVAIKGGMILMEPIKAPVPCAACGGKGVEK